MNAVPVESVLSLPVMDRRLNILLGMKVMHAMQIADSTFEYHTIHVRSPDVSNTSLWISKVLGPEGLSFFTAACTVVYLKSSSLGLRSRWNAPRIDCLSFVLEPVPELKLSIHIDDGWKSASAVYP
jgi:hypothetical protein